LVLLSLWFSIGPVTFSGAISFLPYLLKAGSFLVKDSNRFYLQYAGFFSYFLVLNSSMMQRK